MPAEVLAYLCPICNAELDLCEGDGINVHNGVTVYCPSRQCPSQQVMGHGDTIDHAYAILKEKNRFSGANGIGQTE